MNPWKLHGVIMAIKVVLLLLFICPAFIQGRGDRGRILNDWAHHIPLHQRSSSIHTTGEKHTEKGQVNNLMSTQTMKEHANSTHSNGELKDGKQQSLGSSMRLRRQNDEDIGSIETVANVPDADYQGTSNSHVSAGRNPNIQSSAAEIKSVKGTSSNRPDMIAASSPTSLDGGIYPAAMSVDTDSVAINSRVNQANHLPSRPIGNQLPLWNQPPVVPLQSLASSVNSNTDESLGLMQVVNGYSHLSTKPLTVNSGPQRLPENPYDLGFTDWSTWSRCTVRCGGGITVRTRACAEAFRRKGIGRECLGSNIQTKRCHTQKCPIDGRFSPWSSWSDCSATCGRNSMQRRKRLCDNPPPRHGGLNCYGRLSETRICIVPPCVRESWNNDHAITGNKQGEGSPPSLARSKFTQWGTWSECSKTCGRSSFKRRERTCIQHEGNSCNGTAVQLSLCPDLPCAKSAVVPNENPHDSIINETRLKSPSSRLMGVVTGNMKMNNHFGGSEPMNGSQYTEWTRWTKCPPCGHGIVQTRQRAVCSNTSPANQGKLCKSLQVKECISTKCKDGGFSDWTTFSRCSNSCGAGVKRRRRKCRNLLKGCHGRRWQTVPCKTKKCHSQRKSDAVVYKDADARCSYDPCKVTTCPSHPSAMCVGDSACQPVFFTKDGYIIESCKGILTVQPHQFCGFDPCFERACTVDLTAHCVSSVACKPTFVSRRTGHALEECTGYDDHEDKGGSGRKEEEQFGDDKTADDDIDNEENDDDHNDEDEDDDEKSQIKETGEGDETDNQNGVSDSTKKEMVFKHEIKLDDSFPSRGILGGKASKISFESKHGPAKFYWLKNRRKGQRDETELLVIEVNKKEKRCGQEMTC